MSNNNNHRPLGMLLQNAGLIDSKQLHNALKVQSKYPEMKLGEILVLQEEIETKTINFFVNKWQEIEQEGRQFPIGYYLKNASLLNEQQIQNILAEQKKNKLKFGDIAVHKGWLRQNTVNFFIGGLSVKIQQQISLILLEQYNQENLYLERKYANPSLIMSRVLAWTGGNPTLTKSICQVFANSDFNIPAGLEVNTVDRFVEGSVIKNWKSSKLGTYIRIVKENLVNNQRCPSTSLLREYQAILLSGSKQYQQTKEQKELLILGLVANENNNLRVSNLIYKHIFNQDWVSQELAKLKSTNRKIQAYPKEQENQIATASITKYIPKNSQNNTESLVEIDQHANDIDPITKMSSFFILGGIILLIPLVIAVNNYYSPLAQEQKITDVKKSEANKLLQFCNELNLVESKLSLNLLSQLEKNKQELLRNFPENLEIFPENCEIALNKLRVLVAPQLGKENRVIEAIKNLCKIPPKSESLNEAKVWLKHWYNSPSWGKETQSYLDLVSHCPANDNR